MAEGLQVRFGGFFDAAGVADFGNGFIKSPSGEFGEFEVSEGFVWILDEALGEEDRKSVV